MVRGDIGDGCNTGRISPNPLTNKSFLWSSQSIRTWLELPLRAKQYTNNTNLTPIVDMSVAGL
jgi:hypothetical protein